MIDTSRILGVPYPRTTPTLSSAGPEHARRDKAGRAVRECRSTSQAVLCPDPFSLSSAASCPQRSAACTTAVPACPCSCSEHRGRFELSPGLGLLPGMFCCVNPCSHEHARCVRCQGIKASPLAMRCRQVCPSIHSAPHPCYQYTRHW